MIKDNVERILTEFPQGVELEAAAKKRSIPQIIEAIDAGVGIVGENYVQEAQDKFIVIGNRVQWHLIGHLQKNKVKLAVKIFDMIETIDSIALAHILDKECEKIGRFLPGLVEVNSASEPQKHGVLPEDVEGVVCKIMNCKNLRLMGLMTMGPFVDNPEIIRPFFKKTKDIFDKIKQAYGNEIEWKYLSMGSSDTYKIALEEGANIVRVGTAVFGPRK